MTTNRPSPRTPAGGAAVVRPVIALAAALWCGSPSHAADVRISAPECAVPGSVIEVALIVDPEGSTVVGLQALLRFDSSVLRLISFEQGDSPYVVPIWSSCDEPSAKIDVAVGFDPAHGQAQSPVAVAKRMRFEVLPSAVACSTEGLIGFREEPPFVTMLTTFGGAPVSPDLVQLGPLTIAPPPSIAEPADVTVVPPTKMDCAIPALVAPQATASCGASPVVTFVRSDGATSLNAPVCRMSSPMTVTWTAVDDCGRSVSATQVVTVPGMPADLNSDGMVDAYDLAVVLGAWGSSSGAGDLNGDLNVDGTDLSVLLSRWTDSIP